jgi:hypothetical protein
MALRIYEPQAGRWGIQYFSAVDGVLGEPVHGRFEKGVWHFEQAFSADGGRTWEVNWIADDRKA